MLSLTQSPCVTVEGIVRGISANTPSSRSKEDGGTHSKDDDEVEAVSPLKPVELNANEGHEEAGD